MNNIKTGTAQKLEITLDGAKWDPALATNKSKRAALLKGFTTKDQTKAWSVLSNEISSADSVKIEDNILSITIPTVSNYSIIRDQVVDIVIPKSVLLDYKYDIPVTNQQLKVTVPPFTPEKTIGELLTDGLADYIKNNGLENIRVMVPAKYVETISVNTTEFPGVGKEKESITIIEVTTNNAVEKVKVMIKGKEQEVTGEETEKNSTNKFTFVFTNLEKNSDLTVSVFGSGSDPLQGDIYKKITNGSKTYNELPKESFEGSYSLYTLLTDKTLLKDIFKYYSLTDLQVGK